MDVGTGLTVLGSAKLAEKLLGPTFAYLGEGIKTQVQKGLKNLDRIFLKAVERLGERIEDEGQIPPKVVGKVLREGVFSDNELSAEYFGGILASARTPNADDDRGAYYLDIVSRLSTYQLRAHYVLYVALKRLYNGSGLSMALGDARALQGRTFVPFPEFVKGMDATEEPVKRLLHHIFDALAKESLIELDWMYGNISLDLPAKTLARVEPTKLELPKDYVEHRVSGDGIVFFPGGLGIDLFMWAHGRGDLIVDDFLDPRNEFDSGIAVHIPENCRHVPTALQQDLELE